MGEVKEQDRKSLLRDSDCSGALGLGGNRRESEESEYVRQ